MTIVMYWYKTGAVSPQDCMEYAQWKPMKYQTKTATAKKTIQLTVPWSYQLNKFGYNAPPGPFFRQNTQSHQKDYLQ